MLAIIASAVLSAPPPPPMLAVRESCWAVGWVDPGGTIKIAAGDRNTNKDLLTEALITSGLLWYPWVFPPPQRTPMQSCFRLARETCEAQGGTVCWAYFIPALGDACLFGCKTNGDCPPPPPIPPVALAGESLILSSLVQEVSTALWEEG